jgi:hypothetical protein
MFKDILKFSNLLLLIVSSGVIAGCLSERQRPGATTYALQVTAGFASTCIKGASDVPICYGASVGDGQSGSDAHVDGYVPDSPEPNSQKHELGEIVDIDAGLGTGAVCAVLKSGEVACWGWQNLDKNNYEIPKKVLLVPGIVNASSVGVGMFGSLETRVAGACAVLLDRTVSCWTFDEATIADPQTVGGLDNVSKVSLGGSGNRCALKNDKSVWCWGSNDKGQLGLGDKGIRTSPTLVPSLSALSVSSGTFHTCAVRTDNAVACWGACSRGAVGVPSSGSCEDVLSPHLVEGAAPAKRVSAGLDFSCAVMMDNSVKCWGDNAKGQLGIGMGQLNTHVPTVVQNVGQAEFVSAGQQHACASSRVTQIRCWGQNTYGQLTDGTVDPSFTPVPP